MPVQEYYIHPKTKENHCGRCGLVVQHVGDPHNDTEGRVCEPGLIEPEATVETEVVLHEEIAPVVISAPVAEIDDFDSGGVSE